MASGGFRPGSGPMRGAKYKTKGDKKEPKTKKPPADTEADKIRQMLDLGTKAKAKFYQEFLIRVSKGEKLSLSEKKMMDQLSVELAKELSEPGEKAESEGLQPLEYMLRVMNDPKEDPAVRRQMAAAAAPYIHPKAGEAGKKDEKNERAAEAGKGKFKSGRAPLSLVQ